MEEEKIKKIFAIGLIILLGLFLSYALFRYITAFFGALILFVLLRPLFKYLNEKKNISKKLSAFVVIILSIFIILIPLIFIINSVILETGEFINNREIMLDGLDRIGDIIGLDFRDTLLSAYPQISEFLSQFILNISKGVGNFVISLVITYFSLFYLLVEEKLIKKKMYQILPFNNKNSKKLVDEFRNITYSTVFTAGIIAVIQGLLITITLLIFGVRGAFLLGLIAGLLAFIPFLGPPVVWIPLVIWKLLLGDYPIAVGLLVAGLIVSNIDNFIRPYLQQKVGKIHPLITIVGVFMGIPIFGIIGIIVGPLLLSYFMLMAKMFNEEYL